MSFRTKLDYSDNRQIQQRPQTLTILSGGTAFGVTFSALTTGPDLLTSGVTSFITSAASTFSGNSATTVYNWYDPIMALGYPTLTALTPSTSANTQNVMAYSANTTTVIDGNTVTLDYVGVNYDITCSDIYDLGGGNYSGTAVSLELYFLTASTLDFTGRTIWADVSGITRTENLIITNNPIIGNVWMCMDTEGRGYWSPVSAASTTDIWISGTGISSAVLNGSSGLAIGSYSVAEGYFTTASGTSSHAEGSGTTASGNQSHAEGYGSKAIGDASHAEGGDPSLSISGGTAIGRGSHAEGGATTASGLFSHAEGSSTTASNGYSHAEGFLTKASGPISHAEGYGSIASGSSSHAEGLGTTAGGGQSHAEGIQTTASGDCSHAEGHFSKAIGDGSHAEGGIFILNIIGGTAIGNASHAEGILTTALGPISHAEGSGTTAFGYASHAQGIGTYASGTSSHTEGFETTAYLDYGHAEGYRTTSLGPQSHSEGYETVANGNASHAEGYQTTAIGQGSHTQGVGTRTENTAAHASGSGSTASGATSFVHGNNSIAGNSSTIVLGSFITGTSANTTYVDNLNVKTVGSTAFANDIRIDANGNLTTNTSDERLKENILPISGALSTIQALQGVSYQWKDKNAGTDAVRLGFIAQQVDVVDSRLVFTNSVDGYMGLHIDGVIPLLVEAVKELSSGSTTINNSVLQTQTVIAEDNNIDLNFGGTQLTAIDGGIRVLHAKGTDLSSDFILDANGDWTTNNDFKPNQITIPLFTPSGSTDTTGGLGNITRDDAYIYVKCSDGWKRSNLESF